ncbi:MAG: GIY-YIG nuclease family protein [Natronomonas sp.]
MTGGTYTILFELPEATAVEVGALGDCDLPAGYYGYTGSAFGPGGFSRVDRHYELAAGDRAARHWHIDYVLGDTAAEMRGDVRTPAVDIECAVARSLPSGPVDGFGASDCGCETHLCHATDGGRLRELVAESHREHSES